MIIVLMNYIKKYTDGTITVRPEWVPRLNDIDGIADVLREIDKHVRWPNGPEVAVIERRNLPARGSARPARSRLRQPPRG
ncbi:hypothetical protein [Actinomadura sp. 6N118]|uniref:hypothetical protein n=1 Tax=Actinomadura sp. 6N118 TaxID=3375151 RepID=UPI0037B9579C